MGINRSFFIRYPPQLLSIPSSPSGITCRPDKKQPAEETALVNHIRECYQSMLPVDVELLHYYANELLRARGDNEPVGKN